MRYPIKDKLVDVKVKEDEEECELFCQVLDYRAVNHGTSLTQKSLDLKACCERLPTLTFGRQWSST
jgi:hypothetical protein